MARRARSDAPYPPPLHPLLITPIGAGAQEAGAKLDAKMEAAGAKIDAAGAKLDAKMNAAGVKIDAMGDAAAKSAAQAKENMKEAVKK